MSQLLAARWRAALLGLALLLPACQQKMAEQPSYRPLVPSPFFPDGRSARPLEEGVIARTQPLDDSPLITGLTVAGRRQPRTPIPGSPADAATPLVGAPDNVDNYVKEFPFKLDVEDLKRGQQRYTIYCAVCHDPMGSGFGKIVERGYLRPPSYHTNLGHLDPDGLDMKVPRGYSRGFARWGIQVPLKEAPVGYIFEVISKGYGGMPDYSMQVSPEDRWKITAYVRTLQLSQDATARNVSAEEWKAIQENIAKQARGAEKKEGGAH